MPSAPEYTRRVRSREMQELYGKRGEVYAVTTVNEAPEGFQSFVPYDVVMVEFPDGTKRTFMGMYGEKFQMGDEVECMPAIASIRNDEGIIPYGIKVRHPVVPAKPGQTRFG